MSLDLLDQVEQALSPTKVGVVEFAESSAYCNKKLYPRQAVLLKLIFLEELTDAEEDVLNYWIAGGRNGTEITISPNIRERTEYLRENGYSHFREVDLVGGRRSSKGFVTGIAMAKVMWDCLQLQDPGEHYGIDPEKDIYFSCVAGSEQQAKEFQYADLSSTVETCKAFDPYIVKSLETEIRVATSTDLRKIAQAKVKGNRIQKDIARLRGKALAANAGTLRGSATMAIAIDEMAHMIPGESKAAADKVYEAADPSLDQFGLDGLMFCNPPEAPIWMSDLSFKPIGDVKVGDSVVGWKIPEEQSKKGGEGIKVGRTLCESVVTNVMTRESPLVKVTMKSGRSFRCTPDHLWLTASYGGKKGYYRQNQEWYANPQVGRKIVQVIDPTPELNEDLKLDAAWLGGMFDGEGHANIDQALSIGQAEGYNEDVCAQIENVLEALGIEWSRTSERYSLKGGRQMVVDFANWTNPVRRHQLIRKALSRRWRTVDEIVSVEPDGFGEVIALTTSTGNYVANGYASKNCNSSPYTKVGMFFERYEASLRPYDPSRPIDEGDLDLDVPDLHPNGNPRTMTFQYPSWALFEGYQTSKHRFKRAITVSPDWDPDEKLSNGELLWSSEDIKAIYQARSKEKDNPEAYKVERRGKFAEVTDAFLEPGRVDQMFEGVPTEIVYEATNPSIPIIVRQPLPTNTGLGAINLYRYKIHVDPSSTTAGFGFALGHTERIENSKQEMEEHVVFDIIKRWQPKNFPGQVIKWEPILKELVNFAEMFRPFEITFDQHQSAEPIQDLQERLRDMNISTRVYEKVATNEINWKRWEVFKTALYQGLVHGPFDTEDNQWASQELKFLQQHNTGGKYPRVDRQEIGPVQTKDMADCIAEITYTLIGNMMSNRLRDRLSGSALAGGSPGGYRLGGTLPKGGAGPENIEAYYQSRSERVNRGYANPARGIVSRGRGRSGRR